MSALVAEQDRLADEAREAMPYAFDECSYGKGYLRQSVWSCVGEFQDGDDETGRGEESLADALRLWWEGSMLWMLYLLSFW